MNGRVFKRCIVLLLGFLPIVCVRAQFDPQIGHYVYMPTSYNPAAAGEGDMMRVGGAHRMQFVDITNAPMTTWFSFTSPFVVSLRPSFPPNTYTVSRDILSPSTPFKNIFTSSIVF